MAKVLQVYKPSSEIVRFLHRLWEWVALGYASRAAAAIDLYLARFGHPALHRSVWEQFYEIRQKAAE